MVKAFVTSMVFSIFCGCTISEPKIDFSPIVEIKNLDLGDSTNVVIVLPKDQKGKTISIGKIGFEVITGVPKLNNNLQFRFQSVDETKIDYNKKFPCTNGIECAGFGFDYYEVSDLKVVFFAYKKPIENLKLKYHFYY